MEDVLLDVLGPTLYDISLAYTTLYLLVEVRRQEQSSKLSGPMSLLSRRSLHVSPILRSADALYPSFHLRIDHAKSHPPALDLRELVSYLRTGLPPDSQTVLLKLIMARSFSPGIATVLLGVRGGGNRAAAHRAAPGAAHPAAAQRQSCADTGTL